MNPHGLLHHGQIWSPTVALSSAGATTPKFPLAPSSASISLLQTPLSSSVSLPISRLLPDPYRFPRVRLKSESIYTQSNSWDARKGSIKQVCKRQRTAQMDRVATSDNQIPKMRTASLTSVFSSRRIKGKPRQEKAELRLGKAVTQRQFKVQSRSRLLLTKLT